MSFPVSKNVRTVDVNERLWLVYQRLANIGAQQRANSAQAVPEVQHTSSTSPDATEAHVACAAITKPRRHSRRVKADTSCTVHTSKCDEGGA